MFYVTVVHDCTLFHSLYNTNLMLRLCSLEVHQTTNLHAYKVLSKSYHATMCM